MVVLTKSTSTRKINYLYNATGQKVAKKVTNNSTETMTDYQGLFHYENQVLKFIATAEGYVNTNISSGNHIRQAFSYVYNYTDHLGNIRLSYTASRGINNPPVILEENHYYPFGLKHKKYGSVDKDIVCVDEDCYEVGIDVVPPMARKTYQYKYNGKEYQDELGLNFYDYGARNYQPDLGRFFNIDRFAEKYYTLTPYQYGGNNPIYFVDIKGDSLNVGRFRDYDKEANNMLIGDLSEKTGLSLNVGENGNVSYETENGKKTGSKSARKALIKLINSQQTVSVEGTEGLTRTSMDSSDPNLVLFNPQQTLEDMANTSKDLNSTTNGFALTFFHELGHTKYGGRGQDPPFVTGQNPYEQAGRQERLPNKIRRELGSEYGQRSSYNPYFIRSTGQSYFPWSKGTLNILKRGEVPTKEYIAFPIGN